MKCDFVCNIEKFVLLLSFLSSEVFPAYTLGCNTKENYNNVILEALSMVFVASIERRLLMELIRRMSM